MSNNIIKLNEHLEQIERAADLKFLQPLPEPSVKTDLLLLMVVGTVLVALLADTIAILAFVRSQWR